MWLNAHKDSVELDANSTERSSRLSSRLFSGLFSKRMTAALQALRTYALSLCRNRVVGSRQLNPAGAAHEQVQNAMTTR